MCTCSFTDCLDKHAPWRNVRVRHNTPHPWYDSDIVDGREKKRKLDNVWRRTKLEIHRQLYVTAREEGIALISARKADYYQNRLEKANIKTMFRQLRSFDGQRRQQHPEFHIMNCFHISSVKRSINSFRFCSASTPLIGQRMKNVVSTNVSMCVIQLRTQRSQRFVVLLLCLLII